MFHKTLIYITLLVLCHSIFAQPSLSSVLISGMVIDATAKQPAVNAMVLLLDIGGAIQDTSYTNKEGIFLFKVASEQKYQVSLVNAQKQFIDTENISTIGKQEGELLYTVLQGNFSLNNPLTTSTYPTPDTFHILAPETTCKCVTSFATEAIHPLETGVTFKVEIGIFETPLSSANPFLQLIAHPITIEITPNQKFRYLAGIFTNIEEAEQYKTALQEGEFGYAIVVAYYNGIRLRTPVNEVLQQHSDKN